MVRYLRGFQDFSGGLSEAANDNIKDNQLIRAQNIIPGDGFGLARADGTEIAFPQIENGERIVCLFDFTPDSEPCTMAFTASALYRLNNDDTEWTEVVSDIPTITDYFIHAGKLYWVDGVAMQIYDGEEVVEATLDKANPTETDLAVWDKVSRSTIVEQRGQRWFYARSTASEVLFSEVGNPRSVGVLNVVNVVTRNDNSITSLKEFNEGVLIFKRRSVHYLTGWDFATGSDIQLTQLNVSSGTMFHQTVKTVENAVLYLGYNGVYRLHVPISKETIAADNISEMKISKALFAEGDPSNAYAEVWENVYYLTVEADTRREYRYYTKLKSFYGPYTQGCTCYSVDLAENALFIGCPNGYALRHVKDSYHYIDTNSGTQTSIPIEAITKGFDVVGAMVQDAKVKKVLITARQYREQSSKITAQIRADYSDQAVEINAVNFDESLVYGEGEWGGVKWGWVDTVTAEMQINRVTKRIQAIISGEGANEPMLIYGIAFLYKKKKVKGSREGVTNIKPRYDI